MLVPSVATTGTCAFPGDDEVVAPLGGALVAFCWAGGR